MFHYFLIFRSITGEVLNISVNYVYEACCLEYPDPQNANSLRDSFCKTEYGRLTDCSVEVGPIEVCIILCVQTDPTPMQMLLSFLPFAASSFSSLEHLHSSPTKPLRALGARPIGRFHLGRPVVSSGATSSTRRGE